MRIPEETIEEIRSKSDIVDVIGSYMRIKKAGSDYEGLCPFHNEKSPSFKISPYKQMFKCFGCGKGGNVFSFVMEYEHVDFLESVKLLAEKAGVALPEDNYSPEDNSRAKLKHEIFEINKRAALYFHNVLKGPEGEPGYQYLKQRQLSDQTIVRFGLGYSPAGGSNLYQQFKNDGFSDKAIKESLLFKFDEKYGARDVFWNRVMFPIMDANNKVVAFGGRVMGDAKPKYLNSSETLVFNKSETLYGFNISKRTRRDFFLLCEGYMDVIALHQAGFDNAIASLGTALTSQHAREIKKQNKKVYITYDSDGAGVNAALRAIPILASRGVITYVVNMQPYKDPDEFIKALGADEYQKRIENAMPGFDFRIRQLETHYNMEVSEEANEFYEEVAKICLSVDDEFDRSNYIKHIEKMYQLEPNQFLKFVSRKSTTIKPSDLRKYDDSYELKQTAKNQEDSLGNYNKERLVCEKLILTWATSDRTYPDVLLKYLKISDFQEGIPRTIATQLFSKLKNGATNIVPASFCSYFETSEEQSLVCDLFQAELWEQMPEDIKARDKAFSDSIVKLLRYSTEQMKPSTPQEFSELVKRKKELSTIGKSIISDIEKSR